MANGSSRRFKKVSASDKTKLLALRANLSKIGVTKYCLMLPETSFLVNVLEDGEKIKAAIYGHHPDGRGALFVTPNRIIFIDKKPFFLHFDEFGFLIVSSVMYTKSGLYARVTLRTRAGEFVIKTMNFKSAEKFVLEVEKLALKERRASDYDYPDFT